MEKDAFLQITKGASIIFMGTILASIIGLFNQILMGRILGPSNYGLFSLGLSIMLILCVLPNFGFSSGLTQFIPYNIQKKNYWKIKKAINFSIKFTAIIGVIVSISLFLFSDLIAIKVFNNSQMGLVIKAFSIALTFWSIHNTAGSLTQAFKTPQYYVYIENLAMPLIQITIFILLYIIGYRLFGAIIGFIISSIFGALSYIYILHFKFNKSLTDSGKVNSNKNTNNVSRELIKLSFPLFLAGFTFLFMQYPDKIILGIYTNSTDVGLYTAAFTISTLLLVIYTAFSFNFRPVLAEYFAKNKLSEMANLNSSATKWIFLITFPLIVYIIIYSKELIGIIYGSSFLNASIPLSILALGVAFNGLTGLTGETLISIKRTDQNFYSEIIGAISNLILNITLIPFLGIIGAALGTSLSIILKNISSFFFVYKNLKFNPYNLDYLKIILYSTVPLIMINYILNSYLKIKWAFLIAAILFFIIYFVLLTLTEFFDETDKFIIRSFLQKIKIL